MATPGWYPDTTMAGTQRYWDGTRWTEHVAPLASTAPNASSTPQPRRKPDGSLRGPSLASALIVIVVGIALAVASVIVIVPAFVDTLSGPRWDVPGTQRVDLEAGTWVLFVRQDLGFSPTIRPDDVAVDGPGPVDPTFVTTTQTLTINARNYSGRIEFDIDEAGTYDITVRGEPSSGGEVLLARPIWDFFGNWPWFVAGAVGGFLVVVGVVLWIVGGVNRGRAKRAA